MPRNYKRKTEKAKWSEEQFRCAIAAIEGGRKIREVGRAFGIHEATLRTRMKAGNIGPSKLGRNPVFTEEQETELAAYVSTMAKVFFGVTCIQLRRLAYDFAEANNIKNNFDKSARLAGKDWLRLFLKRRGNLSLRKPEGTSLNRINAFNKDEVALYFRNLEEVFSKHKFQEDRIYNVDETGINTVQKPERILATKGCKQVGGVTSWERGKNVTVICCCSAAGSYIPPMFIYPRQRMSPLLSKGGPIGAIYGCSPNGWSNEDLFYEWLKHFGKHAKPSVTDPVLLLLDNHGSHISMDIYEYCRKNGIVMVTIPPHTSHRLQPLDLSFFSSLKSAFNRECDLYMKTHVNERITPYELSELFNKAYLKVATLDKAQSGFRSGGVCPLNPEKFQECDFAPSASFTNICLVDENDATDDQASKEMTEANAIEEEVTIRHRQQIPGSSKEDVPILCDLQLPVTPPKKDTSTETRTVPVLVTDISPIPKITIPKPKRQRGQSTILTATPEKAKLERSLKIKKENLLKKQMKEEKTKNKIEDKKLIKKVTLKKTVQKAKKSKQALKRKLKWKEESSSDEYNNIDAKKLCDDDEFADLDPISTYGSDVCLVCSEFGRDGEVWFRCVICSNWSHEECSGWDTPVNYTCDMCLSKQ